MQHLNHFCATLRSGPYVDLRPQFSFQEDTFTRTVTAEVTLPISVDPVVRKASSSRAWKTERQAKKDAAFEAYTALYRVGLVNDNLLPLLHTLEEAPEANQTDNGSSFVLVSARVDPWVNAIRRQHDQRRTWYKCKVVVGTQTQSSKDVFALMPISVTPPSPFGLFWNGTISYQANMTLLEPTALTPEEEQAARNSTYLLLASVFRTRMLPSRSDFTILFVPEMENLSSLQTWLGSNSGSESAEELFNRRKEVPGLSPSNLGLVRVRGQDGHPFIFKSFGTKSFTVLEDGNSVPTPEVLQIEATKFPKRRDFLHPILRSGVEEHDAYTAVHCLNASDCTIDNLAVPYSIFASFIPSIIHRFELRMVAEELCNTVLSPVGIDDVDHVLAAITHSSAHEPVNYQRLEFLGDCVLKYLTSIRLMASHPTWPEGYLTAEKGRRVSNCFLAGASLRAGLDRFIISKPFTGTKWRPRYSEDIVTKLCDEDEKIVLSSKVVADVVESLIGASYVDGSIIKAQRCVDILLPEQSQNAEESVSHISARNVHVMVTRLFDAAPDTPLKSQQLERLIDYTFTKKSLLLEATTHPSFMSYREATALSYQRLEFLGDAVLDYIVVPLLFAHKPELPHHAMHTIRTAMVNASFLAFMAMEFSIPEERINVITTEPVVIEQPETVQRSLWQFMRHTSPAISSAQQIALVRHAALREEIIEALEHGNAYPWPLLARTGADKFFSDIVESVLGAVYVDSKGDTAACEAFVERLGILKVLRRVLKDGVDCLHPKERLGHVADREKVEYVGGWVHDSVGDDAETSAVRSPRWSCLVKIGGREIGEPVEGVSRIDSETEAACRAARVLESEADEERKRGNSHASLFTSA